MAVTGADDSAGTAALPVSFFAERGFYTEHVKTGTGSYAKDLDAALADVRADNGDVPVFLYAGGNATYLVRAYLAEHGAGLHGVVLAGTGYVSPGAGSLKLYGEKLRSLVKPASKNREDADSRALRQMMVSTCGESYFAKLPKNLAVFLASGAEDPAGDRGAGVRRVQEGMLLAGMKDISCRLYPDVADNLLAPEIADTFLSDVAAFLDAHTETEVSTYAANKAYEEKKAAEKKDYEIDQILI